MNIELIILISLFISFIILTSYEWLTTVGSIKTIRQTTQEPISIIIALHNEEKNLLTLISCLQKQTYAHFEVVFINDRSIDGTASILGAINDPRFSHITIDNTPPETSPKKHAITEGIARAQHQWLLFTDGDCLPPATWVETMASYINQRTDVIVGLSPYQRTNTPLNHFIQLETSWTAQQMVGWGTLGMSYMALGRNLLYRRSIFERINGHESHKHLLSGDDDLFIQKVSKFAKIVYCLDHEAHVATMPETTIPSYLNQKLRHLSVGSHYRLTHKIILGTHVFSGVAFYIALLLTSFYQWEIALLFFTIRFIFKFANLQTAQRKFSLPRPSKTAVLFDVPYFLYLSALGGLAPIIKRRKWR